MMDQIACPVCTLYLREGMTLQSHLNTHPKSQVIDALVRNIVVKGNEIVRANPPPPVSQNVVPIVVPQQQVTSITYQQFLSSTSFVNSPIIPPASPSQLSRQTNQSINQYQQYPNQEASENDYNAVYPLQRPYSAHQYTELQNYNPQSKTIDNIRPFISEPNLDNSSYNGSFATHNSREILNEDHNEQFTSSDLASVITDSHRVISNSPPSLYNSYSNDLNKPSHRVISNCVPSSYNSFSNDMNKSNLCVISNSSSNAYNSFSDDLNKPNWEETGGSVNNDEARSPTASLSSVCSVRVRKDLGDNGIHEDNTLVQLSSPQCEEYIIPGFDYRDDDDDDDNHAEPDHLEENSPNSIPLNIHTDESMPPRGELSGQGTNSSVWQVHNENVSNFGMLREDRWRKEVFEEQQVEVHNCSECNKIFSSLQEWRMHASLYHQQPVITESTPPVEILPSRPESFGCVFVKSEKVRVIEEIKSVKNEIKDSKDSITKICRRPPRTCTTCNLTFGSGEEFRNHIKKIHPLECTICGKCFLRNSGLTLHQKRHLKIKPYKCDLCDKSFITNQKLNEHKTVHTGEKPIKCPDCPQKFKRHSNLIQHRQYVHLKIKKKVKDFYCYCGEVFHTKSKLLWHQEIHNPKPKQCMCCKERFIHSASLTRHIRKMHDQTYLSKTKSEPGENVECTHCHKTVLKSSLRYHMLIHDGVKPHPCSTCGKRFLSRWNMKLHEWTHAARASKPHKCKLCKAAFFRLNEFEVHMRSHKNIRPYSCNHCGKQFSHKYNCMRHMREHEEVKMYRCEECGKEFHRNYYLKDHMKVHTGVRPYTCHICAKSSASKTNHNKHLKTHHARAQVTSEN